MRGRVDMTDIIFALGMLSGAACLAAGYFAGRIIGLVIDMIQSPRGRP